MTVVSYTFHIDFRQLFKAPLVFLFRPLQTFTSLKFKLTVAVLDFGFGGEK